jgi:putative membrane protein
MWAAVGYWGWGWWFWAFWVLVIFLLLWMIPWRGSRHRVRPPEEQILRERYARGEITKEEFEQKTRDLRRAA